MNPVNLLEVERVEVTVLVDNYTDLLLLQSTPVARRAPVLPPKAFLAEHGFSCLIKTVDVEEHVVLMDVGISGDLPSPQRGTPKNRFGQGESFDP